MRVLKHLGVDKDTKKWLQSLQDEHGMRFEMDGHSHVMIIRRDGHKMRIGATPSDWRSRLNAKARMRRFIAGT